MKTIFNKFCKSSKFAENLKTYFVESEVSFQSDIVELCTKANGYAVTDWQSDWVKDTPSLQRGFSKLP